jgi:hypothetical protein
MVDYGPQGPVNEVTQRDQYMEFHTGKTEYGAENVLSFHDLHPYYTQDVRGQRESVSLSLCPLFDLFPLFI